MNYPKFESTKNALKEQNISHELIQHPPIKTVEEGLAFLGITASQGASTLIIDTDKGFFALLRRDDHQVDLEKVKNILGVNRVSLCKPSQVLEITQCEVGYVSPFNPELSTLADETLNECDHIYCGTGSPEYDLKITPANLFQFTKAKTADIIKSGIFRQKPRILTGDTPSGKLHLGHYVGTLENRVKLQNQYDTFILLANVHAYANDYKSGDIINQNVYEVFLDNLAVGIDPNVSTIYLESGIPETYELYSYFLTMVTHARAIRNPSVKEEINYKKFDPSLGFICYPVLQAADILGFNANLVPVGEDQLPVIEQTREIARDFNKAFGETFVVPEAKVGRVARLIGTDGKLKMSKSGHNAILLSDDEETLKRKIQYCYTDPARIHATDPGKVEGNPVFEYHRAFNPNKEEVADLENRYRTGKVGDKEVKEKLFIALNNFLAPIREKRKYYEDNPKIAKEILVDGTSRARKIVEQTVKEVREKMGVNKLI
jgi:tryptophanyl-tRNA synthetase